MRCVFDRCGDEQASNGNAAIPSRVLRVFGLDIYVYGVCVCVYARNFIRFRVHSCTTQSALQTLTLLQ